MMKGVQGLLTRVSSVKSAVSTSHRIPTPLILSGFSVTLSRLSFSSNSHSPDDVTVPPSSSDDVSCDVTTQELKQRIDKYLGGDVEALPSIFEAILARKLNGNHEETDDELMDEIRSKVSHGGEDELSDSDEDFSDSDDEVCD